MINLVKYLVMLSLLPMAAWGASSTSTTLNLSILSFYECADGHDNDGDGYTDWPDDPDCAAPGDTPEQARDVPVQNPTGAPSSGSNTSSSRIGGSDSTSSDSSTSDSGSTNSSVMSSSFDGETFPGAEVIIFRGGVIVGSVYANEEGLFTYDDYQAYGYGQYAVKAYDTNGEGTPIVAIDVEAFTTLPPLINTVTVSEDGDAVIDGKTVNDHEVMIYYYVEGEEVIELMLAPDEDGYYASDVYIDPSWGDGYWKAYVYGSDSSETIYFLYPKSRQGGSACGLRGDLNDDCLVNLSDYSIAAYWYKKHSLSIDMLQKEEDRLNADAKIDIADFSIMAYFWTG